eukprot:SAG11_NODE_16618_length_542_cov_1.277652_1_plen_50_part_10
MQKKKKKSEFYLLWTWITTLDIVLDSPWAADSKTGLKSFWASVSMLFFAL